MGACGSKVVTEDLINDPEKINRVHSEHQDIDEAELQKHLANLNAYAKTSNRRSRRKKKRSARKRSLADQLQESSESSCAGSVLPYAESDDYSDGICAPLGMKTTGNVVFLAPTPESSKSEDHNEREEIYDIGDHNQLEAIYDMGDHNSICEESVARTLSQDTLDDEGVEVDDERNKNDGNNDDDGDAAAAGEEEGIEVEHERKTSVEESVEPKDEQNKDNVEEEGIEVEDQRKASVQDSVEPQEEQTKHNAEEKGIEVQDERNKDSTSTEEGIEVQDEGRDTIGEGIEVRNESKRSLCDSIHIQDVANSTSEGIEVRGRRSNSSDSNSDSNGNSRNIRIHHQNSSASSTISRPNRKSGDAHRDKQTEMEGSDNSQTSPSTAPTVATPTSRIEDLESSASTVGFNNTANTVASTGTVISSVLAMPGANPLTEVNAASYPLPSLQSGESSGRAFGKYIRSSSTEYDEFTCTSVEEEATLNTASGDGYATNETSLYEEMTVDSRSFTEYTIQEETVVDPTEGNDSTDVDTDMKSDDGNSDDHDDSVDDHAGSDENNTDADAVVDEEEIFEETVASTPPVKSNEVFIEVGENVENIAFDWSGVPELTSPVSPLTTYSHAQPQAKSQQQQQQMSALHAKPPPGIHRTIPLRDTLPKQGRTRNNIPWLNGQQHRLLGETSFDTSASVESGFSELTPLTAAQTDQPSVRTFISASAHVNTIPMPTPQRTMLPPSLMETVHSSSASVSVYEEYTIADTCSVYEVVTVAGRDEQILRVADLDFGGLGGKNNSDDNDDDELTVDNKSLPEHDHMQFDLSLLKVRSQPGITDDSQRIEEKANEEMKAADGGKEEDKQQVEVAVQEVKADVSDSGKEKPEAQAETRAETPQQAPAAEEVQEKASKRKSKKASKWKDRVAKARQRRASVVNSVNSKDRLGETETNVKEDEELPATSNHCQVEANANASVNAVADSQDEDKTAQEEAPSDVPPCATATAADDVDASEPKKDDIADTPSTTEAEEKEKDTQGLVPLSANQVVASTLQTLPGTEVVDSKPMIWSTVSKSLTHEEGETEDEMDEAVDDLIGVLLQKAQARLLKKTLKVDCNVVLGVTTTIATDGRVEESSAQGKTKTIIVTLSGTPCRVMPTADAAPVRVEAIPVSPPRMST